MEKIHISELTVPYKKEFSILDVIQHLQSAKEEGASHLIIENDLRGYYIKQYKYKSSKEEEQQEKIKKLELEIRELEALKKEFLTNFESSLSINWWENLHYNVQDHLMLKYGYVRVKITPSLIKDIYQKENKTLS